MTLTYSAIDTKRIEDAIGVRLASYNRNNDVAVAVVPDEPRSKAVKSRSSRGSGKTYTIRRGDTLSEIAERNHTTVAALKRANPGLNPNRIRPGKKIRLP